MVAKQRIGAVALSVACLALIGALSFAGEDAPMLPAKTYSSYFVSNAHPLPPGELVEYLYIDSFAKFNATFGLAVVMHMTPEVVTEELFEDNVVLAVIRDGLWDMRLEYVARRPDGVEFRYWAEEKPVGFKAVTPLVVSVPKGAKRFSFIENDQRVHVIALDGVEKARQRYSDVPVAGGWTGLEEVDEEARALFERAVAEVVGVRYEPLLVASQVVNGVNYRFICKETRMTNPPVRGVAKVSFHVSLDGAVSGVRIVDSEK